MAQEKHQIGVRLHQCGGKVFPYVSIIGQVVENCKPVTPEEASAIVDNHDRLQGEVTAQAATIARLKEERGALLKAAEAAGKLLAQAQYTGTFMGESLEADAVVLDALRKAIAQVGREG